MITTLYGDNRYLLDIELNRRLNMFIKTNGELAVERLNADEIEYQKIYDSITSLPFLSTRKLVVIKNSSSNKQFTDVASTLIANISPEVDIIFIEHEIDRRSIFYKLLKKSTNYLEFLHLDDQALLNWVVTETKNQGGSISIIDARYLIDRIGNNQQIISSELNKIILFNKQITRDTINLTTDAVANSTIFDLLESVLGGNINKALTLYDEQRSLGKDPKEIIGMLAWQFHIFAIVLVSKSDIRQIANDSKIHPYVLTKSAKLVSGLPISFIRRSISQLLELDIKLKTQKIDPDDSLKLFILELNKR